MPRGVDGVRNDDSELRRPVREKNNTLVSAIAGRGEKHSCRPEARQNSKRTMIAANAPRHHHALRQ
jgi:hypothetical protein